LHRFLAKENFIYTPISSPLTCRSYATLKWAFVMHVKQYQKPSIEQDKAFLPMGIDFFKKKLYTLLIK